MILGLHHITGHAPDLQKNQQFYQDQLGMQRVKLTVNYDDPSVFHIYYGDPEGSPGSLMTFFAPARWGRPSRQPQVNGITLALPGVKPATIQDEQGLNLHIVEGDQARLVGARLNVARAESSRRFFCEVLGYQPEGDRLVTPAGDFVEIVEGEGGPGVIHHLALRVADDAAQSQWLAKLQQAGVATSPVMDRNYFHSIYFREPGGILLEIATDPPGFGVDEPVLGDNLVLPSWLEKLRPQLLERLPAGALTK
jgi:glyoxalase family protein